jgi:hypothetical protein
LHPHRDAAARIDGSMLVMPTIVERTMGSNP